MPVPVMKTPRIPTLACIGYVSEVGQPKETEDKGDGKPNYYMVPVTIAPFESGRKKVVNFMFRPEWFAVGFDPNKDLKDAWGDKASGPVFICRRLFGTNSALGQIQGLAGGTTEAGDALYDLIQKALAETGDGDVGGAVRDVLRDNLVSTEDDGRVIGYIVSQQSKRVKDEGSGEWETIYTDQTEVSGYWQVTEEGKAQMVKRAKKTKDGMFRVTWEVEE